MTNEPTSIETDTTERLRLEFNDWARAGRGPSMEKGHRPVGEQAIDLLSIQPPSIVIDIGCGSGWAARLMAEQAHHGRVVGIDVSDEMIRVARDSSAPVSNLEFQVASAERLPFGAGEFTHAFSMESLYYYADISTALLEIKRVLRGGGRFVTVLDLYEENKPSHQWIDQLKVPVQLLSESQYCSMFANSGFINVRARRLYDPRPIAEDYQGGSFNSREDYIEYRKAGSLMISGEVA